MRVSDGMTHVPGIRCGLFLFQIERFIVAIFFFVSSSKDKTVIFQPNSVHWRYEFECLSIFGIACCLVTNNAYVFGMNVLRCGGGEFEI